jgi:diacylglycerol kinase (ATP)
METLTMKSPHRACVILNPYSNRWGARKHWPEAEAALRQAGIDFEFRQTQGPGDGIGLAEEAARQGYSPIISAGGDGAMGEVLNGLYRANSKEILGPVGVMPLGTANDLAHNLGLPLDLADAANAIANGRTRRIDLGKINEWVFHNNSAVGLEPVVTEWNVRMVRFSGILRYLAAAFLAIASGQSWQGRLKWDDGEYEGPISLISVGNNPVTGGLFRMAPAADPNDGQLTFVYAYAASRLKMLSLLPRAINGSYVNDPAVHQHHTTRLEIELTTASPVQLDGELRTSYLSKVEYHVLPKSLDILSP